MQVQESGWSCIYVALAGPKSAAGYFPQSEEQAIWVQLVCFITVALKLLSTPSYITLILAVPLVSYPELTIAVLPI